MLAGLRTHRGPILTVANFAGDWPGLVGLLGLNAGLTKMGTPYSTLWSVDFTDEWHRHIRCVLTVLALERPNNRLPHCRATDLTAKYH